MIKLNAGFSRKVGEANYGSRGASVNLELELESSMIADPDKMHEKIRALFGLARRAVDEELRNGNGSATRDGDHPPEPKKTDQPNERNGSVCSNCGSNGLSDKVVKFSTEKFGKPLCYRCQKAQKSHDGRRR